MKRRAAVFLIIIFLLGNAVIPCAAKILPTASGEVSKPPAENDLFAKSAVLMDADSGRILYAKSADEVRANASTTKIMTLIVTLEHAALDDIVTISDYAARQPDVQLNANSGEHFLLEDLCYSLMLESHNDSAMAIAEHVGGSVEGFAVLMNEKAKELGCKNTHFITPNGLDASDDEGIHGTTAADLARIMSYCITRSPQKEAFLTITGTSSRTFCNKEETADGGWVDGARSFSCNNHNAFLTMMEGAISGKTGFTCDAGYCYVGALQNAGRTFVVALLACGWPNNKGYKWKDTRKLMEYGIGAFERGIPGELSVDESRFKPLEVLDAQTDRIGDIRECRLQVADDWRCSGEEWDMLDPDVGLLMSPKEQLALDYQLERYLTAPVAQGKKVGELRYLLNNQTILTRDIVTCEEIPRIDYIWCVKQVWQRMCP